MWRWWLEMLESCPSFKWMVELMPRSSQSNSTIFHYIRPSLRSMGKNFWPLLMPGVLFRCTTSSQAKTASSHTTGPWKMAFTKILSCHLMVDLLLFAVVLVTFICWAPALRNGSRLSKWTEKFTHWPSVLIRAACTVTEVCCFVFSSSLQFSSIFSASLFV